MATPPKPPQPEALKLASVAPSAPPKPPEPKLEAKPEPPPPVKYRLPLVVTCVGVELGAPTVLDCVVEDAFGQTVRARGHMRINVSESTTYEQASAILQSWANVLSKDFLAAGKAERVVVTDTESRVKELQSIVDKSFVGASA